VTSADLSIAVPTGASGGSLRLHFPKGGTNAQSFTAYGLATGQTIFSLTSTQVKTSGSVGVSVGFLARSAVDNASFEDSYTPAWTTPGYLFMNRWTPNTESTGFNGTASGQTVLDFADNGLLPIATWWRLSRMRAVSSRISRAWRWARCTGCSITTTLVPIPQRPARGQPSSDGLIPR